MAGRIEFRIHGMDCADEVAILQKQLVPLVPQEQLVFDILRGKMTVADSPITADQIRDSVRQTGMRAELWSDAQPGAADMSFWQRRGRTLLSIVCGVLTAAGFIAHAVTDGIAAAFGSEGAGLAHDVPFASVGLYGGAIVTGGWFIVPRAWNAVRNRRPDMNLLMTIAVVGAALIGEWFEGAVVTFLFAVSLALESWSVNRARRAVEALLTIAPETARVLDDAGRETEVRADDVRVGARLRVKPGDRIPLDGTVRAGRSQVNQAPITGESLPVEKEPSADVFAGTINGEGALEIEVTRLAGESTLAQIIRMVSEAQSRRAPSEQWVDRFAAVYTPVILALAIGVAVVPPIFAGAEWDVWFYRALVLLVIGCPCALVISTPVSIVASLAAAARHGVLVKGGSFIEAPARLRAIALDKTGTLTKGEPRVIAVMPLGNHTEHELLAAMGAIEAHSDHPLARAIVEYVRFRGVDLATASDVRAVNGRGVTARFNGKEYWLGSHRFLEE